MQPEICRYPIILVHGIGIKDFKFLRAFGRIERTLKEAGFTVYTAKTDGFGATESNAVQLKAFITGVLIKEKTKKVNIVAHSKGGLDSRYMIKRLGMENKVATLTTLCTPHKGSPIASFIMRAPKPILKFAAFWVNLVYRIFGDSRPDALKVCNELKLHADDEPLNNGVYCQSYSTTLKSSRDDFLMGIPLMFSHFLENGSSDGLVSAESSKFENYRGDCIDGCIRIRKWSILWSNRKNASAFTLFICNFAKNLPSAGFNKKYNARAG